jgi:hypothetical protein
VDGLSGKGGEEGEKECVWQMKEGEKREETESKEKNEMK